MSGEESEQQREVTVNPNEAEEKAWQLGQC